MKRAGGQFEKVKIFNDDSPFMLLRSSMKLSPAWKALSINSRKLLDFLEIEHMTHAGRENGGLFATYNQLVEYGIPRKYIKQAIKKAEALGFIIVDYGCRESRTKSYPNHFTLTYFQIRRESEEGIYYISATDEWKKITGEQAKAVKKRK